MSERLSDDGLRDILSDDDAWVTRGEIQEMARELVELRARLSAGPVMPEVPSDDLILRVLAGSSLPGVELILRGMYDAIRSALMQEQS